MVRILISLMMILAAPWALAGGGPWVLTTDYSTFGGLSGFTDGDPWTVSPDLATIPGDAAGRWHEGKVYVLGRGGSNLLQVYDPSGGFTLEREFSLGSGLNPQDIAFDTDGEAYISCYDTAVMLRVDVVNETILETIDTSLFADADGAPETAWLFAKGNRLYVAVQMLDTNNWHQPTGPGAVAVYDMAAEMWVDLDGTAPGVQPIALSLANPYTRFDPVTDGAGGLVLRVGCSGSFGLLDGGIEEIDTSTDTNLGVLATSVQLGGDPLVLQTTGSQLHVLVTDASFGTSLVRLDPGTGQVTVLDASQFYDHADIAWDGGFQLFLADRASGQAGLRVFDVGSGTELTTGTIPTGLPPFMFILPGTAGISPVPVVPAMGALTLGAPTPNPFNPRTGMAVNGHPGSGVRVRILDLRGRVVRTNTLTLDDRGRGQFEFDGRDDSGRHLPAGVYRAVVQDEAGFAARSLTLLK